MKYIKTLAATLAGGLLLLGTPSVLLAYNDGYGEVYIESSNYSQDLDLNAVSSLFGESQDLAQFEWRLNDPSLQISNLDLNGDGAVDYLRVIETSRGNLRVIVIQAIIGRDRYQDVATIEVFRESSSYTRVQVIGDPYIYGDGYIIQPYYGYTPVIFNYFWTRPHYTPYYSHYRWGYYPNRYRTWRPHPTPYYNRQIHNRIDRRNEYRQTRSPMRPESRQMHNSVSKRDFTRQHRERPDQRTVPANEYRNQNTPSIRQQQSNSAAQYNQRVEQLRERNRIQNNYPSQDRNINKYEHKLEQRERPVRNPNQNIPSANQQQSNSAAQYNQRVEQLKERNRTHNNQQSQNYNDRRSNPASEVRQRASTQNTQRSREATDSSSQESTPNMRLQERFQQHSR